MLIFQFTKYRNHCSTSIIKLDKNFHIYVHDSRELIEQGTDEHGRKFYKIYYNEESKALDPGGIIDPGQYSVSIR